MEINKADKHASPSWTSALLLLCHPKIHLLRATVRGMHRLDGNFQNNLEQTLVDQSNEHWPVSQHWGEDVDTKKAIPALSWRSLAR